MVVDRNLAGTSYCQHACGVCLARLFLVRACACEDPCRIAGSQACVCIGALLAQPSRMLTFETSCISIQSDFLGWIRLVPWKTMHLSSCPRIEAASNVDLHLCPGHLMCLSTYSFVTNPIKVDRLQLSYLTLSCPLTSKFLQVLYVSRSKAELIATCATCAAETVQPCTGGEALAGPVVRIAPHSATRHGFP